MDIDYSIDTINAVEIRGWAWLPGDPDMPLTIELMTSDGAVAQHVIATEFRPDLSAAAKRSGWCAFRLPIDSAVPSGVYAIRARHGEATVELATFAHANPAVSARGPFDPALSDPSGTHGWLDTAGPHRFSGWLHGGLADGTGRQLELIADGAVVATGASNRWRDDLADIFQGDGRRGFWILFPPALCDGAEHLFDLRWAETQVSLLSAPIPVVTASQPASDKADGEGTAVVLPVSRPAADSPIEVSIVVNFYNMQREAERTLTSLSRVYQRDVGDIAYEVLCIDNGSSPPMTEDEVTRHGPEFRLVRPSKQHSSPVFALNEAAREARGRYIAVMIDGAHLLSPGVIAEAVSALREEGRAMVAVRHWFIGGDQRWLATSGFQRDQQELPFAKICWPEDGYDLFKISTPIHDSATPWFDDMTESNCLFLSKQDFIELSGYDERFDVGGGGFANLDLFRRAAAMPKMTVVSLIGEATFHQYHEGTTTNVSDLEKDRRVRRYAAAFETLRGETFDSVKSKDWKYRGSMRTIYAQDARLSASGKIRLGLTSEVRKFPLSRSVGEGAQQYLSAAYLEGGGPDETIWLGQPTGVAPADLIMIQRILWDKRPEALLMSGVAPGVLSYIRSIVTTGDLGSPRLIWLTADNHGPTPPGVHRLVGTLADEAIRVQVKEVVCCSEGSMVLFQPSDPAPLDALREHATYVSPGDYMVVLGANFGQPTLGYSHRWISNAIDRFLRIDRRFVEDRAVDTHIISTCAGGFLLRVPDQYDSAYDDALDILEEV